MLIFTKKNPKENEMWSGFELEEVVGGVSRVLVEMFLKDGEKGRF